MNQIKIALVLIVAIFVLLVVGGVTPTLAGSPSGAPPTVVLPTPIATQPKPAATTAPAGKAPTRAVAPVTAPTRVAVKAPRGPAGSWITDFTLFNLSASTTASLTMMRYTQCTPLGSCSTDSGNSVTLLDSGCGANKICANGSAYYNPVSDSGFPTSFSGSITVSSDQPLAGTVNVANTSTGASYASDAYSAVSSPAASTFLPIVYAGLGAWNTTISIQNAGTSNANVTIHYLGAGAPGDTTITGLPPNMTAIVDQAGLATGFNGSATVTSTNGQNLAVVVEEYKTTGGVLVAYNGLPISNAATTVYAPGYDDHGVWATDITIVNTTGTATTASVSFANRSETLSGPLTANGIVYLNRYVGLPSGWSGSYPTGYPGGAATITAGQNIAVAYNISNSGTGGAGNFAMGYVGIPDSAKSNTVVIPLIANHYSTGWDTTFTVQNVEGGTANLQLYYTGNMTPTCGSPCNIAMTTASKTFNQVNDGHVPTGFLGGVKIVSDKKIVVIADQANTTAANYQGGDSAMGFAGFPQ
jgi:hypothetical protein